MEGLSILIPTYNDRCITLVRTLLEQAVLLNIDYEIIVADDGSNQQEVLQENAPIAEMDHCRYLVRSSNKGRAAIRNFLAQQASFPWLLFLDSDMVVCRHDFLQKYIQCKNDVVYGGVTIRGAVDGNLRYLYEHASEHEHRVEKRMQQPYRDFHTANFMIRRELMLRFPFDERFRYYGYEDVFFGITLEEHHITIQHIDNPMSFEIFENNVDFLLKTEEGLRTLYTFRDELKDHSRMLQFISSQLSLTLWLLQKWHHIMGTRERQQLAGNHPQLWIFKLYKIGYYLDYAKRQSSVTNP